MAAALSPAALVEIFERAWALPKPEGFLDHFLPHLHPDVASVQPGMPETHGIAAFSEAFRRLFELSPDLTADVDFWAASGDSVLIISSATGTVGRRSIAFVVCDRFDLADGMIVRRQAYFDPTGLRRSVLRQPRVWPAAWRVARSGGTRPAAAGRRPVSRR